jgi:ADP-ribose pyrophosphatase
MEGSPETLQDTFEKAETEAAVNHFTQRFGKALAILSDKLYRNTRESSWVVPYRAFGLHVAIELEWLKDNADILLGYLEQDGAAEINVNPDHLVNFIRLVAKNEDGVESEACLVHGDLNLANVICDDGDNIWFIDWTHCGTAPVELDFAKLENDVKFVMTKTFDLDDLPRLRIFEDYLVEHRIPEDLDALPDSIKFAKWDLRYRKILTTVRQIRRACFDLKKTDDWLVYRVALLKYATHTLSFDQRRDRGECAPAALAYALFSIEHLTFSLVADDFHLKIRSERPDQYPARQRILIDESIWAFECETYGPPYYVHPSVLANDCTLIDGGWADPEDFTSIRAELEQRPAEKRDDCGRPLNPRGRTGIEGRGLLGHWGANLSVAVVVVRINQNLEPEILLGRSEDELEVNLPKGFILRSQTMLDGLGRVLDGVTGSNPDPAKAELIFEGYTYDPRQTDHAWVETNVYLFFDGENSFANSFNAWKVFDEVVWLALDDKIVNRLPSSSAPFVREAVKKLSETKRMSTEAAERLLAGTG